MFFFVKKKNIMRRFIVYLFLLLPLMTTAQQYPDYQLQVAASLARQTFNVQGALSFTSTAEHTDSVEIVISRGAGPASVQLEGAAARLDTVATDNGDIAWRWHFARKLPAGTPLRVRYHYERGMAPAFQYFIDSSFCMAGGYGSAWYPQLSSNGGTSRGTGTITVTTDEGFLPVMASSTLKTATVKGKPVYEFKYTLPDIFSLYIGRYTRQEYKGERSFYTYAIQKSIDGADISRKAAAVLNFLAARFGPLDIPNFSIIELPEYVSEQTGIGGASILGGVVIPTGGLRRFNYALFGHEIGHQWWGNKVMTRGANGKAMLEEGLAQYGSLQVVMQFDSAHAINYRKTGYPGYLPDQSGLGYLKNAAAGNDEPLSKLTGSNDHMLADSKGFLTLEMLSNVMGKDVFHRALRQLIEAHHQDGLSWEDFLGEMERAHGSSLQWFYQQWFARTGAPAWESSWQQQRQTLQLSIRQKDSLYQLPLEVLVTYQNGQQEIKKITINQQNNTLELPVSAAVADVQIDPYFKILHWAEDLRPAAMSLAKVQRVMKLRMDNRLDEAVQLAKSYLSEGFSHDAYGAEFTLLYILGRIAAMQKKPDEAIACYQRALQCATRAPELLAYTYYRIAQLAAAKQDKPLLQWAGNNAIQADAANHHADGMEDRMKLLW